MVHIPYPQPFMDVNKRTSRLAANISLIHANLCPLSFVDVREHTYTEGTLAIDENKNIALLRSTIARNCENSCGTSCVVFRGQPTKICTQADSTH